jgi:hypothetical protein
VLPRGNEATDEPMSEYDLDLADWGRGGSDALPSLSSSKRVEV